MIPLIFLIAGSAVTRCRSGFNKVSHRGISFSKNDSGQRVFCITSNSLKCDSISPALLYFRS